MRLIVAGVVVVFLSLMSVPAGAQTGTPVWGPKATENTEAFESDGEIVLTLSFWRPGRVRYRTLDAARRIVATAQDVAVIASGTTSTPARTPRSRRNDSPTAKAAAMVRLYRTKGLLPPPAWRAAPAGTTSPTWLGFG